MKFINNNLNDSIPVLEEFCSLQGEGYNTGQLAYFVRVGGCDLACHWCDSKESWQATENQLTPISDIIERAKATKANTIIVTGGEPLIYNFDVFCNLVRKSGFLVMLETSGAYSYSGSWNWICLSPKRQCPPLEEYYTKANEMKIIIYEPEDFIWAEECAMKIKSTSSLYLQPEWSRYKKTSQQIVNYIKENPKWKISVQIHKFLRIP